VRSTRETAGVTLCSDPLDDGLQKALVVVTVLHVYIRDAAQVPASVASVGSTGMTPRGDVLGRSRFQGRIAVVTGAGAGLGAATARRLGAEGAILVLVDIDAERSKTTAAELQRIGAKGIAVQADVSDPTGVEQIKQAVSSFGGADILVNNAAKATDGDLLALSTEAIAQDIAVTLTGPVLCAQALLPGMIAKRSGVICNVGSVNALAYFGNEAYSAAKAGLVSFTRGLAARYGPLGIRSNMVAPGTMRTGIWSQRLESDPTVLDRLSRWYPLGRIGEPEDVVGAIAFLCSDEASWISGAMLVVDGGLTSGYPQMAADISGNNS
jgi:meso-butanediol dehydrogenase/(S,S)-butanediol dehydrogenase/diacetyl reductase